MPVFGKCCARIRATARGRADRSDCQLPNLHENGGGRPLVALASHLHCSAGYKTEIRGKATEEQGFLMSRRNVAAAKVARVAPKTPEEWRVSELLKQYGCGPIPFVGSENAFYERHLIFDRVIEPHV